MANEAPQGTDLQFGSRFCRAPYVPGKEINMFRRVMSVTGFSPEYVTERVGNMDPSGQTRLGRIVAVKVAGKVDSQPDVLSIIPILANFVRKYDIGAALAAGVFPWTFEPREVGDGPTDVYVNSMDTEVTDGDGVPELIHECAVSELEFKIAAGKLVSLSETWLGCLPTQLSEATALDVDSYTGAPQMFGKLSVANAAKVPLYVRVTDAAGAGNNGKIKCAFPALVVGKTVTTAGTTSLVGTSGAFAGLAAGDVIKIDGETDRVLATVPTTESATVTVAAVTSGAGKAFSVAQFDGDAIPVVFDVFALATLATGAYAGDNRDDGPFIIFPSGEGTLAVGDSWSFTRPRTMAEPAYSEFNPLSAAGVAFVCDGVTYGGVPGQPGFDTISVKLSHALAANMTTGSVFSNGNQIGPPWNVDITLDRDRLNRDFRDALEHAKTLAIVLSLYGDPLAPGFDEMIRLTLAACQVTKDPRDVPGPGTLKEKIDIIAGRGPSNNPQFSILVYSPLSDLANDYLT